MQKYARQEVLDIIGKKGQGLLKKKKVCIVGVGALGTVAAELLCRAGVGNLILIDKDKIDETNLQRQTLFTEMDVGKNKADVARSLLGAINSDVEVKSSNINLNYENIDKIKSDLVLDCTDNLDTRFLINDYCVKNKIPWIYASAVKTSGMVYCITPRNPCFRCIFENAKSNYNCEAVGILNTASNTIASVQVTEAIKILLGQKVSKELIKFDIWNLNIEKFNVKKNVKCRACNGKYDFLKPGVEFILKHCKTKATYNAKPIKNIKLDMNKLKKKFKVVADASILLVLEIEGVEVLVHSYGEIVFKKLTDKEKIEQISKQVYDAGCV